MTDRNEHASPGMIGAIFQDWFIGHRFIDQDAYEWSKKIQDKLFELERDGYLIMLRGETRCYHCGARWPKKIGDCDVIPFCKKCEDARNEYYENVDWCPNGGACKVKEGGEGL